MLDDEVRPSERSSATTSARLSNDAEFLAAAGGHNTSTTATRALPSMALWSSLAADAAAAEDSLLLPHHHDSREDERHHHPTSTTTTTTLPPAAEKGRHRASSAESVDVVPAFLDGRTAAGFVAQLKAAIPLNFQTRRAVTIGIATTCVACIVILACALRLVHRDAGGGATVELTSAERNSGVDQHHRYSYDAPHAAYRTGAAATRNSMQCTQWRGYNLHSAPGTTRIVHPGGIGTRSFLLIFVT